MANRHYEKPAESSRRAGADEGEIGMTATGEIGMPSGSLVNLLVKQKIRVILSRRDLYMITFVKTFEIKN